MQRERLPKRTEQGPTRDIHLWERYLFHRLPANPVAAGGSGDLVTRGEHARLEDGHNISRSKGTQLGGRNGHPHKARRHVAFAVGLDVRGRAAQDGRRYRRCARRRLAHFGNSQYICRRVGAVPARSTLLITGSGGDKGNTVVVPAIFAVSVGRTRAVVAAASARLVPLPLPPTV